MRKYIILFCLTIAALTYAQDATARVFEFEAVDGADFYVIYRGETSKAYNWNSGKIEGTEYNALGETDGEQYFYSIVAFSNNGNSSDFSDELSTEALEKVQGFKFKIDIMVSGYLTTQ